MDITQYLKYNNLEIHLIDLKKSISGWSLSTQKYVTKKIESIKPTKVNTYYILNGVKFYLNSEVLIRLNNNIESVFVSELYDKFQNGEDIFVLNYKLENVKIDTFEFIEKASVRNYCTFLNLSIEHNLYVPYSEYSILIKGALFI